MPCMALRKSLDLGAEILRIADVAAARPNDGPEGGVAVMLLETHKRSVEG